MRSKDCRVQELADIYLGAIEGQIARHPGVTPGVRQALWVLIVEGSMQKAVDAGLPPSVLLGINRPKPRVA